MTDAYVAGRPKGPWFKRKRGALTADCAVVVEDETGDGGGGGQSDDCCRRLSLQLWIITLLLLLGLVLAIWRLRRDG